MRLKGCDGHIRQYPHDFHSFARRGLLRLLLGKNAMTESDFLEYRRLNPDGAWMLDHTIQEALERRAAPVQQ